MTSNHNKEGSQVRSVCVVLIDRANYGRLKPVMSAIDDHPTLSLQVLAGGTLVLDRFQRPVDNVRDDGFRVDGEVFMEVEGNRPTTMAKSVGLGIVEFTAEFQRLKPDVVVLIGDRYEALAATIAAVYSNLCVVHLQGGEVSGSIDESARHAISKLAHYHVPSTQRAANVLLQMGERPESILAVGCPSSDVALALEGTPDADLINSRGSGAPISFAEPYLLVVYHPTTTRYGDESSDMEVLLQSLDSIAMPTLMLWPNIDAGADQISKAIRVFRERQAPNWLRLVKNLPPEEYLRVLASAACAVGNSSSFVRDAGFFGTPVVLLGDRQQGRERGSHVVQASLQQDSMVSAIGEQVARGTYPICKIYGDGEIGRQVAQKLVSIPLYVQKSLHMPDFAASVMQ